MRSYGCLSVLIGPYASLWVLMILCEFLSVFMGHQGSLWMLMGLCTVGPYAH